jgi:hypothetical protein
MGSSATLVASAFVDLGLQKRSRFPGEMGVAMGRLGSLTALLGALLLASMASTAGAAPLIDRFHGTLSVTFPDSQCGIDGTSVFTSVDNIQVFADDTFKSELRVNQVFTSAATGKSVLLFVADQFVAPGPRSTTGTARSRSRKRSRGFRRS